MLSLGTGTAALMLSLLTVTGWAQALCAARAVCWRLAVAASTAFGALVLGIFFLLVALGALTGHVAGAVVGARALAALALVAVETLVCLLSRLLCYFRIDGSHRRLTKSA